MVMTKRAAAFSVILLFLFGALAAVAEPSPPRRFSNPLLDDVVQMTRAGLSDATIVAYLNSRRARLDTDLNADDLIRLQKAGVSETVVRYIASAGALDAPPVRDRDQDVTYDSGDGSVSSEPSYSEDEAYPEAYPYAYAYGYGYPYWYAYSPYYFSGSVFFGGRPFFRGRSFANRSFGHRGGRFTGRGFGGRGHR
jgi:hypothetical protein